MPDPWFEGFPDVKSINRQAFEGITDLIKNIAASPRMPLTGTILGEAGDGKTHLYRERHESGLCALLAYFAAKAYGESTGMRGTDCGR